MKKILKNWYIRLKYGGNRLKCYVCKENFRKMLPLHAKWYVRNELIDHDTPDALCPQCGSWIRHRFLVKFIEEKGILAKSNIKLLHFAPEDHLADYFTKTYPKMQYFCGDIDIARYKHLKAIELDIRKMPLENESFDAQICYHVLELIDNDGLALSEMHRLLKPQGWAMIAVPIYGKETFEKTGYLTDSEREKLYGYPYNYRLYGLDFVQKLEKTGFSVETYRFSDFAQDYYDPSPSSPHIESDQYLFFCRKK